MPDWLIWIVAIASIIAALAQVIGTWLQWFMLRELGDMDGNSTDWWEKVPWRKKECEDEL